MIQLLRLAPELIEANWTTFEAPFSHIERRSRGLWTVNGIRARAFSGDWQIWGAFDDERFLAVAGTQLIMADSGEKWAEILFCTGLGRALWQEKLSEIEDWARAEGCTRVRSIARLGWARTLPGYRVTHAFIERSLS